MRKLGAALVLLVSLVPVPVRAQSTGLVLVSDTAMPPRTHQLVVYSPALQAKQTLRVILPSGYDPSVDTRYPVLYLLHGAVDDYTSWTRETDVEAFTTDTPLIVVMPDAGRGGFYTDWYNNGLAGQPRWESYHIGELIPWIDGRYRTVAARDGRAIAGLSMGGFGAFTYASRHPDLFVAAASFSGAVDTGISDPVGPEALEVFALIGYPPLAPPGSLWGLWPLEEERWRSHNPLDLAENLGGLQITLRTGNGQPGPRICGDGANDPIESGVHDMSVNVHARLDALGIDHVWEDYGPGSHQWPCWERDLHLTLPDIMAAFGTPGPVPFTYVSGEPSFSVYGFDVVFDRGVREMSRMADAQPSGFSLTGTGIAHVTTAGWYAPGSSHAVSGVGTVVADAAGRLSFAVDLGPPNMFQQYTPMADALQAAMGEAYQRTVEVTIA